MGCSLWEYDDCMAGGQKRSVGEVVGSVTVTHPAGCRPGSLPRARCNSVRCCVPADPTAASPGAGTIPGPAAASTAIGHPSYASPIHRQQTGGKSINL